MSYQGFGKILTQYEDTNLSAYSDMDYGRCVFTNPENKPLRDNLDTTTAGIKNCFTDVYHWVKGELADLTSLQ